MRTREDPCARSLCNLLHLETAGRRIFWWAARAGPGARWLLLPCLRSFGGRKRSIVVHHRVPGKSLLHLMISLCPGCHAKVGRTKVVLSQMPPLLLELWREQHPLGHEQTALDFKANFPAAKSVPLFRGIAVPESVCLNSD